MTELNIHLNSVISEVEFPVSPRDPLAKSKTKLSIATIPTFPPTVDQLSNTGWPATGLKTSSIIIEADKYTTTLVLICCHIDFYSIIPLFSVFKPGNQLPVNVPGNLKLIEPQA
jgi:hypothetical protein